MKKLILLLFLLPSLLFSQTFRLKKEGEFFSVTDISGSIQGFFLIDVDQIE